MMKTKQAKPVTGKGHWDLARLVAWNDTRCDRVRPPRQFRMPEGVRLAAGHVARLRAWLDEPFWWPGRQSGPAVLVIVGPAGSGKTRLSEAIRAFLPDGEDAIYNAYAESGEWVRSFRAVMARGGGVICAAYGPLWRRRRVKNRWREEFWVVNRLEGGEMAFSPLRSRQAAVTTPQVAVIVEACELEDLPAGLRERAIVLECQGQD